MSTKLNYFKFYERLYFFKNSLKNSKLIIRSSHHSIVDSVSSSSTNINNEKLRKNFEKKSNHLIKNNADLNKFTIRSHNCGQINDKLINETVELCGWLEYERMQKFLILRDSYGKVQLFIKNKNIQKLIGNCNLESVIKIKGKVSKRPEKDINPQMINGNVEIIVDELELLNNSKSNMPFLPRDKIHTNELVRLEYRYIDLRRSSMLYNLRLRSKFIMDLRNYLVNSYGFIEVETPTLFKATPGGAQEFLVPTRFKDHFYNLVQSPQQFKQLLMVGGIDRYFQIARCYRDEGTKSDRQPEFTQLDIEMSFTKIDQVMNLIEILLKECWPIEEERVKISKLSSFPMIKYEDAMKYYGCDKPDLRSDIQIQSISDDDNTFLLTIPSDYDPTFVIKDFINEELNIQINTLGFKGYLNHFKYSSLPFQTNLSKKLLEKLNTTNEFKPNDFLWIATGDRSDCLRILGRIRNCCIDLIENDKILNGLERNLSFVWIYDFPLFIENEITKRLESSHHPFTAPKTENDKNLIYSEPSKSIGQSFDLVINGREIGGGSIRIQSAELQNFILENILKSDSKSLKYFLEALNSGCPPHGGFAIGLDRLLALICQEQSIRDVIAFPKAAHGKDLMSGSPCPIDDNIKRLYGILK